MSTFGDLYRSVADILNFQLYSVPLVGADICGFGGMCRIEAIKQISIQLKLYYQELHV